MKIKRILRLLVFGSILCSFFLVFVSLLEANPIHIGSEYSPDIFKGVYEIVNKKLDELDMYSQKQIYQQDFNEAKKLGFDKKILRRRK